MKKILAVFALFLTIAPTALAQSNPPLSNKRIRMKGQAAPPTPDPPTGYYNLWVDSATGALNITDSAGTDTPVGSGLSGLTTNNIPYATGATTLGAGPLYRAAAARIGLGGTTDSEPGFRWAGTTIDFVTAGAGAFIRINALEYQIANTTVFKNSSDGIAEITDTVGTLGGVKVGSVQGAYSCTLTDNTIKSFVQISSATTDAVVAGRIECTIVASDATNHLIQTETVNVPFLLLNENGTVTATVGTVYGSLIDSAGGAAFANTFATSVSGTNAMIRVTSNYDQATLTGTVTHTIYYRVVLTSGMATVTPQS